MAIGGLDCRDWLDLEFDYFIPPDVAVAADGTILEADWPKVYRFTNGGDQWALSFTGMGMPAIKYIDQTGPFQHGSTLLDYRLQPRIIQYVHRRNDCRRCGYWSARSDLINWIRPNRQLPDTFEMGRLRKVIPDGTTRDIDAILQQGPMFTARNPNQWDEWSLTETLRFICPDPTFYDPEEQEVAWGVAEFADLIFYELPNYGDHWILGHAGEYEERFVFAETLIIGETTITYGGTWLSYPTIEITGPVGNPVVRNLTTDEKIELNYSVSDGEVITIELAYGSKTVENGAGTNLIGTVTSDSDLATFHLAPDPEATNGQNQLSVAGTLGAAGTTQIRVTWYVRYIGI